MTAYRKIAATLTAILTMTMLTFATAAPASAIGGNCDAHLDEDEVTGYNNFRAGAMCSSLDGDTKARPKLIRDGGPDYTGVYFTRLNTTYHTSWYTCYSGCWGAVELAHV